MNVNFLLKRNKIGIGIGVLLLMGSLAAFIYQCSSGAGPTSAHDLLTTDNSPGTAEEKSRVIEGIASDVTDLLMREGLTKAVCGDLEKHAYSVNDGITDAGLRNMNILAAV